MLSDLLFGLEGRIGRQTWWGIRFFSFLILLTIGFPIATLIPGKEIKQPFFAAVVGIWTFVGAIAWWIDLATTVKRWHDRDHSGWMYLIPLIPIIGPLWTLIECGFFPGTPGRNRYGPPQNADSSAAPPASA